MTTATPTMVTISYSLYFGEITEVQVVVVVVGCMQEEEKIKKMFAK